RQIPDGQVRVGEHRGQGAAESPAGGGGGVRVHPVGPVAGADLHGGAGGVDRHAQHRLRGGGGRIVEGEHHRAGGGEGGEHGRVDLGVGGEIGAEGAHAPHQFGEGFGRVHCDAQRQHPPVVGHPDEDVVVAGQPRGERRGRGVQHRGDRGVGGAALGGGEARGERRGGDRQAVLDIDGCVVGGCGDRAGQLEVFGGVGEAFAPESGGGRGAAALLAEGHAGRMDRGDRTVGGAAQEVVEQVDEPVVVGAQFVLVVAVGVAAEVEEGLGRVAVLIVVVQHVLDGYG